MYVHAYTYIYISIFVFRGISLWYSLLQQCQMTQLFLLPLSLFYRTHSLVVFFFFFFLSFILVFGGPLVTHSRVFHSRELYYGRSNTSTNYRVHN